MADTVDPVNSRRQSNYVATMAENASSSTQFDPTRALPNSTFRDHVWFAAELNAIWHADWVFACTEAALPEPGDQVPVTIGRQPVLLIRNQDSDLVAVSNLCSHRGTKLVEESTNAKRIQCPYHAWTYADSGRLLSVPFSAKGEVNKADHCLPSYRVESWHGLVFVSLNPDVEDLATRFAAVDAALNTTDLDALHHWPEQNLDETWDCNWKLAMLNAMESYHLFHVHPETLEPFTPTKDSYYLAGSARGSVTGGLGSDGSRYELISLPPGFVGVLSTDGNFIWTAVQPLAIDRCRLRFGAAYGSPPPARDASRLTRWVYQAGTAAAEAMALPDFLPEDRAICERGQRGALGDFEPGPLLEIERVVQDFGHYLAWQLNEAAPPAVHTQSK